MIHNNLQEIQDISKAIINKKYHYNWSNWSRWKSHG